MGPSRHNFLCLFGPTSESEVFVTAFQHQRFCGGWQLVTANINKESAVDVDHTVTRLLSPEFVRADLPVILALQETRSWDVAEMHVPGIVVYRKHFCSHFSPCV